MAVIRNERKFRYTVVPNDPLRNANLTLQAKGLLALMLSYPDDWSYNLTHLEGQSKNKRDAHRNALRELIAAGYAEWRTVHGEDGTFKGRELVVTDVPFTRGPEKASDGDRGTENTADGRTVGRKNRPSEKPTVGKSDTTKTVNHEDPIDEEPPLPPQEPVAAAQGGEDLQALEDQDLTPYQRWQRDKPPSPLPASRLASSHPAVWSALAGFRRAIGKVTDGQFAAWTAKVVEHVEKYGERTVIDALETTTLKAGLKDPFAYYRKVVGRAPSGEPEYREVSAAEFLEGSWN